MAFPLAAITGAIGKFGGGVGGAVGGVGGGASGVLGSLGSAASMVSGNLKSLGSAARGTGESVGTVGSKLGSAMSSVAGIIPGVFGKIAGAAAKAAATFNEITSVAAKFVSNFDPAIVAQFQLVLSQLDATIGQSLRPVIVSAINIVRGFGGAINQAMRQLAPIVEKVADSIASMLQPAFDALGSYLESMMPVFDFLADVASGVAAIFGDLFRAIQPLISMVSELAKQLLGAIFGGTDDVKDQVKGFMESIRNAVQSFVKNLILAVASFLKMIGAMDTLKALIKGLQPPKKIDDIAGNLAPQNVAFKGLGDVAKSLMQAAFVATAAGGAKDPKKAEDFLGDILKQVEAIADGKQSELNKQAQSILDTMISVNAFGRATVDYLRKTYEFITNPTDTGVRDFSEAAHRGKSLEDQRQEMIKRGVVVETGPDAGRNDNILTRLKKRF